MTFNKETALKVLYVLLGILGAFLFIRYVLAWVAPFLLALLTARLMEPAVRALRRRVRFKRGLAAAVCSVLFLGLLLGLIVLIVVRLLSTAGDFVMKLPDMLEGAAGFLGRIKNSVTGFVADTPQQTKDFVDAVISNIEGTLSEVPQRLSAWALGLAGSIASGVPKFVMFFITYAISVFFISAGYPQIIRFIMRQVPPRWHQRVLTLKHDFVSTLGKWLKAQAMMMGITFTELCAAFAIMRIPYSVLIAAVVALIDALPVFGTGTILIPWAIITLIGGETHLAVGLALTYGVVSLVRSILEPRLIGGQIGLHPVVTLIAMYIGFCTVGVLGMILFPLGIIMLKQFHDRGYVKLWK